MILYSAIIGTASTPDIAARLHVLEHAHRVDTVFVPRQDLSRRRLRIRSSCGADVAIALPRDKTLFDGAVLRLDPDAALVVRVEAETWLRLRPASPSAALRLGHHAGNLHWRVKFDENDLLVAVEGPVQTYRARMADMLADGLVTEIDGGAVA